MTRKIIATQIAVEWNDKPKLVVLTDEMPNWVSQPFNEWLDDIEREENAFEKIEMAGNIEEKEMRRVFNLGIGFCLIVPPEVANDALNCGMKSWIIGEVNETPHS